MDTSQPQPMLSYRWLTIFSMLVERHPNLPLTITCTSSTPQPLKDQAVSVSVRAFSQVGAQPMLAAATGQQFV